MVGLSAFSECRLAARDRAYPKSRRSRRGEAVCVDHLPESGARGIGGLSSCSLTAFSSRLSVEPACSFETP